MHLHVPRELIRPDKLPSTCLPAAFVGPVSQVGSMVCLQVTRPREGLDAAFNGTSKNDLLRFSQFPLPFWLPVVHPRLLGRLSGCGAGGEL